MFLTAAGAPYDLRWKELSPEPFEAVPALLSLPLSNEALVDVSGDDAPHAQLREVPGFGEPRLTSLGAVDHAEWQAGKAGTWMP